MISPAVIEMKEAKTTQYRSIAVSLDHPLSQGVSECGRYGKVYEHRLVLFDKIGNGTHKCHWCKKVITWDGSVGGRIVADHLDGDKWNNTASNLVESCWRCNFARETRSDFLTHCGNGHEWTEESTYTRPDGTGRNCKICESQRQKDRARKNRKRKRWNEIITEEMLAEMINERMTLKEMADCINCSITTIQKAKKEYGYEFSV